MWNGHTKKAKLRKLETHKKGSLFIDEEHEYKENLGR